MRGRYGIGAVLLGLSLALAPRAASASDLVVAVEPGSAWTDGEPGRAPPRKKRDSAAFAASLYAMTATATDDFQADRLAFVVRPALELYVAIGLGDVSMILGGTTLAIEVYAYDERTSVNYPALLTMGIHHDRWLVELAGGASLGSEDSEGTFETGTDREPIPSPRGELRGGVRFIDMLELRGVVGAERRIANESDGVTRFFAGVAFGIGGS